MRLHQQLCCVFLSYGSLSLVRTQSCFLLGLQLHEFKPKDDRRPSAPLTTPRTEVWHFFRMKFRVGITAQCCAELCFLSLSLFIHFL